MLALPLGLPICDLRWKFVIADGSLCWMPAASVSAAAVTTEAPATLDAETTTGLCFV